MSTVGQIHWHEGLFLQPHHLQTLQRDVVEQASRERRLGWAYPYGVSDLRLSTDALENMLVRIDRLKAFMPSGMEVDVPGNADIPALDIKRVFQSGSEGFTVSLAVPLWQSGRANAVEPAASSGGGLRAAVAQEVQVKRLYRVAEVSRVDENTGENPQPLLVRRLNARLVVEGDDTTDMELLPLLRIVHATDQESSLPRQDTKFIPPCLLLSGSPTLRNILRDLGNHLEAKRKELVNQMTRGGFVLENLKGPQMLQMLRLRTLNKAASRLPSIIASPATSPFDAYLELREILGDLAALSPDRDPFDAPKYDHDNPGPAFMDLDEKIRRLAQGEVRGVFLQIPFVKDGTTLAATLTEEHLTQPNGYFLGIRTKMDPTVLGRLAEDADKFKLMPKSMVRLNIYGLKLQEERHPPLNFPSAMDLHYFRVVVGESQRMWERVVQEKALAIRWAEGEPFEYQDIQLYMSVP